MPHEIQPEKLHHEGLDTATQGPGKTPYPSDEKAAIPENASVTLSQNGDQAVSAHLSSNTQHTALPTGYSINAEIGRGGMGVVYSATDNRLKREVALKMLLTTGGADTQRIVRFLIEAEAMALIRHPHVVQVFEAGELDGQPFLAMEFLPGGTLASSLAAQKFTPREAATLMLKIARGVEAAHRQGVIHRDLKPSNVMFDGAGEPKVTDFGLAKHGKKDLTATESQLGTPAYMAPEQARGETKSAGPQADVFALGVMLFEMTTGKRPFDGENVASIIYKVIHESPVLPRSINDSISRDLEIIILKCLQKEIPSRYADAGKLADDLECFLSDQPISARAVGRIERARKWMRRNPTVAGSLAVAVIALVAGTAISTWQARRASAEADESRRLEKLASEKTNEALDEKAKAQAQEKIVTDKSRALLEQTRRAEEQVAFMRELFNSSDPTGLSGAGLLPAGQGGQKVSAGDLLTRGAGLMEKRFKGMSRSDRLTRAALLDNIGDVSRTIGLMDQAKPLLKESLEIRNELLENSDPDLNTSRLNMANWHTEKGDIIEAESLYLAILDSLKTQNKLDSLEAANVQIRLAVLYVSISDQRSDAIARAALATRLRELGEQHRDTAFCQCVLAASLFDARRSTEAIGLITKAFGTLFSKGESGSGKTTTSESPSSTMAAISMLTGLGDLNSDPVVAATLESQKGILYSQLGWTQMALGPMRKALTMMEKGLGKDHLYNAMLYGELAITLKKNGSDTEAEQKWRECARILRKTIGVEHPRAVVALAAFAEHLVENDQKDEAWSLMMEILQASEKHYGKDVPWRFRMLGCVVRIAVMVGKSKEASAITSEAVSQFEKLDSRQKANEREYLSDLGVRTGRLDDLTACRKVYEAALRLESPGSLVRIKLTDLSNFGTTLIRRKLHNEAKPIVQEINKLLDSEEMKKSTEYSIKTNALATAGDLDWALGKHDEAVLKYQSSIAEERKKSDKSETADNPALLIKLLILRHQFADSLVVCEEYGQRPISDVSRAWNLFQMSALRAIIEKKGNLSLGSADTKLDRSLNPDVVMYRTRATVINRGDVKKAAAEVDRLLNNPKSFKSHSESLSLARASCAISLGEHDKAIDLLRQTNLSASPNDSKSHLREVMKSLAIMRKSPTLENLIVLSQNVIKAEVFLTNTRSNRDPNIGGYATSNQLELRWLCRQIRIEFGGAKK